MIDLELVAIDGAGNESPSFSAQVTATAAQGADACEDSTGGAFPVECLQEDPDENVDDDPAEDVDLKADQASGSGAGTLSAPANYYRIVVTGNATNGRPSPNCPARRLSSNPCLTTIRSARQSYVVGSAADGSTIGAIQKRRVREGFPYYYLGNIANIASPERSYRGGCGWVRRSLTQDEPFTQSSSPCDIGFEGKIKRFARKVNCRLSCTHGTAIVLERSSAACANTFPLGDGITNGCHYLKRNIAAGTCVEYRYVTRDNQWVMVKDRRFDLHDGSWVFIRRTALEEDSTRWPNIGTPGRSRCTNDGELLP